MAKRKSKNYINNAEFYETMVKYRQDCREAEDSGDEPPEIPKYVGEALHQIANRLSHKPNFYNYSYRDEMIADGLENAVASVNNFDPEKSNNPFAYFTQVIYYAFLRRIQKEKKQLYIKHKVVENSVVQGTIVEGDVDGAPSYIDLNNDYMNDFVEKYEESLAKKSKAKKGLEKFCEDE